MRRIRTQEYNHFFVTRRITMGEMLSSADNCFIYPLFSYQKNSLFTDSELSRVPNFNSSFINKVSEKIGLRYNIDGAENDQQFGPYDLLHYIYALFYSFTYRQRYADYLKDDYPRILIPSNSKLFIDMYQGGADLVALHLMESPKLNTLITKWQGTTPSNEVEEVTYSDMTVWIDKGKTEGFCGVPENVWNFRIGGYQVCEKWLKDRRGRVLSTEDITHYQKIVVTLNETIRLMKEIDEVIEEYGGWPGAFE